MTVIATRPHLRPAPVIAPEPLDTAGGVVTLPLDDEPDHDRQPVLALDFHERDAFFGPQPTASADLPSARVWAQQVSQALVEVLGAHRPVSQLVRWTTTDVYARLARGSQAVGNRHARRGRRPVVRSVHVSGDRDGLAEVTAVVVVGERVRALAFRMVGRDGRWVIDELVVG